ncbi:MAG: polysaccharide biosynthesis C-terminal domain-containing protein [Bdellovibrionota bacterium]|nr:MAG: polysaccharide biosynthesis C-terminal domain-containing protein [Bdellovibrionota bacterium]
MLSLLKQFYWNGGPNTPSVATVLFGLSCNVFRLVLTFLTTIVVARYLGANDYGVLAIILAYTYPFIYLLTLGFDNALPTLVERWQRNGIGDVADLKFQVACLVGFCVFAILFITGLAIELNVVPQVIASHQIVTYLLMAQAGAWAFGSIFNGVLRSRNLIVPGILREHVIFPVFHLLLSAIALSWLHGGLHAYASAYLLSTTFASAILFFIALKNDAIQMRSLNKLSRTIRTVQEVIPLSAMAALDMLISSVSIMVLANYVSHQEVATFAIGLRVCQLTQIAAVSVSPYIAVQLLNQFKNQVIIHPLTHIRSPLIVGALGAAVTATLLIVLEPWVWWIFGLSTASAPMLLPILLLGFISEACNLILRQVLVATGSNRINLVSSIVGVFCTLLLTTILCPTYGLIGAAIALAVATLVAMLMRVRAILDLPQLSGQSKSAAISKL